MGKPYSVLGKAGHFMREGISFFCFLPYQRRLARISRGDKSVPSPERVFLQGFYGSLIGSIAYGFLGNMVTPLNPKHPDDLGLLFLYSCSLAAATHFGSALREVYRNKNFEKSRESLIVQQPLFPLERAIRDTAPPRQRTLPLGVPQLERITNPLDMPYVIEGEQILEAGLRDSKPFIREGFYTPKSPPKA